MSWYNAGTVAVTNNNATVTGTGTAWADYVDAGQAFVGPDGLAYEIASVLSATSITLASNYKGATASGQSYRIMPVQGYLRDLATQAASLVLSFATVRDGVGQGKFPDGTVGTPGIRFANDEDTGFYRPGANLLDVVTNGTRAARFQSNGNISIGTTNDKTRLNVAGAAAAGAPTPGVTSGSMFVSNNDNAYGLLIGVDAASGASWLQGQRTDGTGTAYNLWLNPSGGNVGIGTANPSGKLHVEKAAGVADWLYHAKTAGVANDGGIWVDASNNMELALRDGSGSMTVRVGATGNSYISAGSLGIGTNSPSAKLHVVGAGGTYQGMALQNNFGSASVYAADYIDFKNELGVNVANMLCDINTDGSSSYAWSLSPAGARNSDRRTERLRLTNTDLRPGSDNAQDLGTAAVRWANVRAGNGTIQTSDERAKQDIGPIPDEWLDAWGEVEWIRYKFRDSVEKKSDDARWHAGLVAQRVRDIFAARSLDAQVIGLLCYDEWSEQREPIFEEGVVSTEEYVVGQEEVVVGQDELVSYVDTGLLDENEKPIQRRVVETVDIKEWRFIMARRDIMGMVDTGETRVTLEAGDRWGLRYDECQAMEAAWQRRELVRKDALIATMEARLAGLVPGWAA